MTTEDRIRPSFRRRFDEAIKRSIFSGRNVRYVLPVDTRRANCCRGEYSTRDSDALIEPFHTMASQPERCPPELAKTLVQSLWRPKNIYANSVRSIERQLRSRETWIERWNRVDVPTLLQIGTSHLDSIRSQLDREAATESALLESEALPPLPAEDINIQSKAHLMEYRSMRPITSLGFSFEPHSPTIPVPTSVRNTRSELGFAPSYPVPSLSRSQSVMPSVNLPPVGKTRRVPSPSWRPKSAVALVGRTHAVAAARYLNSLQGADRDELHVDSDPNYKPQPSAAEKRFTLLLQRRAGTFIESEDAGGSKAATLASSTASGLPSEQHTPMIVEQESVVDLKSQLSHESRKTCKENGGREMLVSEWVYTSRYSRDAL